MNETGSTKADNYNRIPTPAECSLTPGAAYVHITSNNTIEGTQWKTLPEVGDVPLVSDASSDIFSGPIDVAKYGLIYAGAQKNLGPSGVTLVIVREDLLARSSKSLHTMLNYAVHAENGSLYNTPPAFGIYVLGLVDGVAARAGRSRRRWRRSTRARPASCTPSSIAPASGDRRPRRTAAA